MSDLLSLFPETERADIGALIAPATHDDPLPPLWPANGIPPHPFSTLNRMMSADEGRELRADIAARGLMERIVIFQDKILDGRNRYLECVALGLFPANVDWRTHPAFVEFGGRGWDSDKGSDALGYVWSQEVRRHMSAKDLALRAARYMRFLAQLQPEFPEGKTAKLRLPTQEQISKRYGISERLVHSAMVLLDRAEPEVVAAVEGGKLALSDAADVVSKLEPEEQKQIAAVPDRKAAKAAVKAAKPKASKAPPAPELPSPLSRTALATFAEEVVHLALAAAKKHKGPGASISADAILDFAVKHDITEGGAKGHGFTRQMLLALGQLRDNLPASAPKPEKEPATGPTELPLGAEWSLKIGGLNAKHTASIAVFHEEDETYSISINLAFANSGRSDPFGGAHPDFRTAIGAAAAEMRDALDRIAGSTDSVTTKSEVDSAYDGITWLDVRMAEWGIVVPELQLADTLPPPVDQVIDTITEIVGAVVELQLAYDRLVEGQGDLKGHHSQATAEPILRAGVAADIPRKRIGEDIGHPTGTVATWCNRLGLQDPARIASGRAENFKRASA